MTHTFDQAIAALAGKNTLAELFELARDTSARVAGAAPGATSLLYAGTVNGEDAWRVAAAAAPRGSDQLVRVDDTDVGRLYEDPRFTLKLRAAIEADLAARIPGYANLSVDEQTSLRAAEESRIWSNKDANNLRLPYDPNRLSLWDLASKNFVEQATGNFRVLAADVNTSSVLMQTELPALLVRGGNFQVDGVDINHLRGISGTDAARSAILTMAESQTFFSDVRSSSVTGYISLTPDDVARAMEDPVKLTRYQAFVDSLEAARRLRYETGINGMVQGGHAAWTAGVPRALNRLGLVGGILGFAAMSAQAGQAHSSGDSARAQEIVKEWGVDAAGSWLGATIAAAAAGIALGAVAVAGVAVAAPVAGALVLGASVIGGIFGAEGATELYRLLDDRDANGRRDVVDRLVNLLYGATLTIVTPLPADLNGAQFTIDAALTRDEIIANARNSMAWRYALRELNGFVVSDVSYDRHNVDGSLDLYDPATGQGAMTERYLIDRAAMLMWRLRYQVEGARDDDDGAHPGPKPYNEDWDTSSIQGNWDFVDLTQRLPGGQPLTLAIDGVGLSLHDHQVVFGSGQGETIEGEGDSDILYGLAGDDTLRGVGGDDYLEGNADNDTLDGGSGNDTLLGGRGNDTYRFSGDWGTDTIIESDGNGSIHVDGIGPMSGAGTNRTSPNSWQTADGTIKYSLVSVSPGRNDLIITVDRGGARGTITVQGWTEQRAAGVTSLPVEMAEVQTDYTLVGDGGDNGHNYGDWDYDNEASSVTMLGMGGADSLFGFYGRDVLPLSNPSYTYEWAAAQTDYLDGGIGNDSLYGSDGRDTLIGGDGEDRLIGGVYFGLEADRLYELNHGFNEFAPQAFVDAHLPQWRRELDANMLDGGAGNDYLQGGWGDDALYGGADSDWLFGAVGDDMIFGGDGDDFAHGDGSARWRVDGGFDPNYVPVYLQGDDIIDGGAGNDGLGGHGGADILYGGTGNDTLHGDMAYLPTDLYVHVPYEHQGDDWLDGGDGDDQIYGDGRDDTLIGGIGADSLWGDRTQDALYAEHHGDDVLDGGAGNDQLAGGGGDDQLDGGAQADLIFGDDSVDRVSATYHGADLIDGGEGNDTIVAGGGDDNVFGDGGDDWIQGDDNDPALSEAFHGADYLDGGTGNDTLLGHAGADTLVGGTGNDRLDGGRGADTFAFASGDGIDRVVDDGNDGVIRLGGVSRDMLSAITINQVNDFGGTTQSFQLRYGANDLITFDGGMGRGFSHVVLDDGSTMTRAAVMGLMSQDLVINGDAGLFPSSDALVGGGGNDTVNGGAGNDTLYGGAGINVITGGSGSDTYEFSLAGGEDRIDNRAGDSAVTTDAVRFADGITTGTVAFYRLGNDLIVHAGSAASMTLVDHFAAGAEAQRVDQFRFADGTTWSAAQVEAGLTLGIPTGGPDFLTGTAGSDTLAGGAGNDTLLGGEGSDVLDGGSGSDTYHLSPASGMDRVVEDANDSAARDVIQVQAGIAPSNVFVTTNLDQFPFWEYGGDLFLGSTQHDSRIVVQDFFVSQNSIEEVRFADGTTWTAADVLAETRPADAFGQQPISERGARCRQHRRSGW